MVVTMLAASDSPQIIAAYIVAGGAVLATLTNFIVNRRTNTNTHQLGMIEAVQEGMRDTVEATRADNVALRAELKETRAELGETRAELSAARVEQATTYGELRELRAEVDGLRTQLATSLSHYDDCEAARSEQGVELERLRALLHGGTSS